MRDLRAWALLAMLPLLAGCLDGTDGEPPATMRVTVRVANDGATAAWTHATLSDEAGNALLQKQSMLLPGEAMRYEALLRAGHVYGYSIAYTQAPTALPGAPPSGEAGITTSTCRDGQTYAIASSGGLRPDGTWGWSSGSECLPG